MTRARDVANLIGSGNYSSTTFTATAGQTVFSIAHTQNFVQVFMNGLLLDLTVDYTSNGSAVTLTSGAAAGDEIEVVAYNTFSVGDALNQAAADTRYVNTAGDTMTGALTVSGAFTSQGIDDNADATAITIDSSGNLLVGKTATGITTVGAELKPTGELVATVSNDSCVFLNRTSSDGNIVTLRKDNSNVGQIGTNNSYIYIGSSNTNLRFHDGADAFLPANGDGTSRDNNLDLGSSGARFDDIFATNSSIQTSDETEKQNIASLTSAEITAATAISKLFKTFKWKDKVAAKGDDARIHTGVIAQQVQAAMSDAGLDASKYAFWCSNTWTNDDGNKQTRLGVRYPELLAFICAATEQRLTNIETRLAVLEGG